MHPQHWFPNKEHYLTLHIWGFTTNPFLKPYTTLKQITQQSAEEWKDRCHPMHGSYPSALQQLVLHKTVKQETTLSSRARNSWRTLHTKHVSYTIWVSNFALSRESTFLSLLGNTNLDICLSPWTVVNGDSCMNSHYQLISKCKHSRSNNGVLMSWQKWEKMVSRIWEWLSGKEDKDHAWRTARTRKGREKRSQKLRSTALQDKWEFSYHLFPKAVFPLSSVQYPSKQSVAD